MAELSKDKERDLKNVMAMIEKDIAKGAIMRMGEMTGEEVQGISTGSLSLDLALGGKGLPRGRIIEIYGAESSGKTTIALHAVANAQRSGGIAAYIDAEHALDPSWAKRLGVDLENLLVSQPAHAEEGLRIAEMLVKSNAVDIIVIDSVAALVPKAEIEGEIGDAHVGLQARLMSQALRILTPIVAKSNTCIIFINQIRQKVGVFFGSPETTSGGLALKFYASVRMSVTRVGQVKKGDETIGSEVQVKVVKNKVAPPFRNCRFELMYDHGISAQGDAILLALEDKIVEKKGNWIYYGELGLGNGSEKAKEYLRENPSLYDEIVAKVLAKRGANSKLIAPPETPEEEPEELKALTKPPAKKGRGAKQAESGEE
ncbi:MAG: recombinase RecA [Planctomycetia bacterium]|nr:recombinase RecA [Planctomycetia bacterium]